MRSLTLAILFANELAFGSLIAVVVVGDDDFCIIFSAISYLSTLTISMVVATLVKEFEFMVVGCRYVVSEYQYNHDHFDYSRDMVLALVLVRTS